MKTFASGLSIILPTAIILYIMLWVLEKTESIFKDIVMLLLPKEYYFIGLGIISGFILVYSVGLLLKIWIFNNIKVYFETLIDKTPVLNILYGAVQDFFNFTSNMKKSKDKIVVLVDIPSLEAKIMAFVTLTEFENFENVDLEEHILVYMPMSYQMGGYSLFVPKKNITPIDMKLEEAIRFTATAGISTKRKNQNEIS
jgi:uncharacterized membrane protein